MKRLILIIVVINLLFFLTANNVFAQCNPTTVFTYPTPGYNFHGFVIQSATLNIAPGDEIGVFAPDGLGGEMCVGACGYTGTLPVGFQAEEDDPNTVGIKEGFAAGDPITFRIWDASENEEYVATLTYLAGDVNFASAGSTIYGQ
ncbi:MAG: hypothetical protein GY869_16110, partial [Planctomycetes bacterium]|nr:hypothetical protein [Planctomycetota bacterium]